MDGCDVGRLVSPGRVGFDVCGRNVGFVDGCDDGRWEGVALG